MLIENKSIDFHSMISILIFLLLPNFVPIESRGVERRQKKGRQWTYQKDLKCCLLSLTLKAPHIRHMKSCDIHTHDDVDFGAACGQRRANSNSRAMCRNENARGYLVFITRTSHDISYGAMIKIMKFSFPQVRRARERWRAAEKNVFHSNELTIVGRWQRTLARTVEEIEMKIFEIKISRTLHWNLITRSWKLSSFQKCRKIN